MIEYELAPASDVKLIKGIAENIVGLATRQLLVPIEPVVDNGWHAIAPNGR